MSYVDRIIQDVKRDKQMEAELKKAIVKQYPHIAADISVIFRSGRLSVLSVHSDVSTKELEDYAVKLLTDKVDTYLAEKYKEYEQAVKLRRADLSQINFAPTTPDSYDGSKLPKYHSDEPV